VTCVVGVVGATGVLLAGDAQWSDDRTHRIGYEPKVFIIPGIDTLGIAYCGSGRLGQILTYHMSDSLEEPSLVMDEHYWAVREFIPYLRTVTQDHGFLHILEENQVEQFDDSSAFLLAVRGRLFSVEHDFSVNEHILPYEALGSGTENAIGVLHAEMGDDKRPLVSLKEAERVAKKAIKAAAKFGNFVGGPITVARTVAYTNDEKRLARQILRVA
jgi:20S proteasome alpha/beta subunit